jgi:outer membrane protein OmpA-like peptidoglycan-associated protein
MNNRSVQILGLVLSLFWLPLAATAETSPAVEDPSQSPSTQGWYLFGGLDAGYSMLSSSVVGEENKSGLGGNLKLLGSHYWDQWVFDAGFGLEYKNISGTRPTGFSGTLETRTFLIETDFRRRFGAHWEGGVFLAANTFADVSHRPTINPLLLNEPEKNLIFLFGLQGLYSTMAGNLPLRFGARLGTDLNIPNRRLVEVQAVLQIGFPLFETAPPQRPPAAVPAAPPEYFEINLLRVLFETDSAQLTPKSKEILARLGNYFKSHLESFTRVEIEGHTDKQGSHTYNLGLSQQRADAVAQVLTEHGVPKAIVLAKGYGFTKPLVKDGALEQPKNRRVIILIYGAGEKSEFISELKKLVQ